MPCAAIHVGLWGVVSALLLQQAAAWPAPELINPEASCPQPFGPRKYAVVCYAYKAFKGRYLELMVRPWIHHIRHVEPDMHIIIATPKKQLSGNLRRVVDFSHAVYGNVYLRTPQTITRADLPPDLLEHLDMWEGLRDQYGWAELQFTGIWNLDEYDGILHLDPDAWLLRPIRRLLWCTERFHLLSAVGPWEPLAMVPLLLRPSRHTFARMREVLRISWRDANGGWDGMPVQPPKHPGSKWAAGTHQTFLFHVFYVAKPWLEPLRVARIDACRLAAPPSNEVPFKANVANMQLAGVHSHFARGCTLEGLPEWEETFVLLHLREHFMHPSPVVRALLAQSQFDSRICWDFLDHRSVKFGGTVAQQISVLRDAKTATISDLRINAIRGSEGLTAFTFPVCCNLSEGPHGADWCWSAGLTFERCCLLQPD